MTENVPAAQSPDQAQEIVEIKNAINIQDTQAVLQYGVDTQASVADFSDTLLGEIRNKDSGHVGEALTELMLRIKDVDAGALAGKQGFFAKLFGGIKAQVTKFMSRFEKLSTQIEAITDKLERARIQLLKDISMLDKLYEKNQDHLQVLNLYIAAGKAKLDEVNTQLLPEIKKKAEESNDPIAAQNLQDLNAAIVAFEKKIHDLQLTRMIAIQTAPQVKLIQQNNKVLVEKIQSSILNTIPLWKNQIVIAISIFRQQSALELQREVSDMTNQMLSKNAEMLKQGTIEVARESERGIVELETLQKVNDDLISTIEETLAIQTEGRERRKAAEAELSKLEEDLKTRLRRLA